MNGKGWFYIEEDLEELDDELGFTVELLAYEASLLLMKYAEFLDQYGI